MTTPFKICPSCTQPNALDKPQCPQCGHVFRTRFVPPAPHYLPEQMSSPPSQPGWVLPEREGRLRSNRWSVIGKILVTVIVVAFALLSIFRTFPPSDSSLPIVAHVPNSADTAQDTSQSSNSGNLVSQAPSSGTFTEHPSHSETPTVSVTNRGYANDTLYFENDAGRSYSMQIPNGATASLTLPAGEYNFRLVPDLPNIDGQVGDATFRRYRTYDLYVTTSHGDESPPSTHIGDN